MLTPIVYKSKEKPSIADLTDCDISGTTIGSGYTQERMLKMQPGVDALWHLYPESGAFFVGLVFEGVSHKDFVGFKHRFEKVGALKIKEGFNRIGSKGAVSSFERFGAIFKDYDNHQRCLDTRNSRFESFVMGCNKAPTVSGALNHQL